MAWLVSGLHTLGFDHADQVNHPAGEAPLVVIPGENLHQFVFGHFGAEGFQDTL